MPNSSEINVLVIDDEKVIRDFLVRFFKKEGYHTDLASSGREALDLIAQKDYNFIICDVKMPKMNGVEFCHEVKKQKPELVKRLVFTSGDIVELNVQDFCKETGCPYLPKPMSLNSLRSVVRTYV